MMLTLKQQKTQKRFHKKENWIWRLLITLETAQTENKTNYLGKSKIAVGSLKEDHEKFIKMNKSILKTQQRFKSEKHNIFTHEVNKIDLSSNNDKRTQSVYSIEKYVSKDLLSK